MKRFTLLLFLVGSISWSSLAQSFDINHLFPIETDHSFIQFEATYFGYAKVRGSFGSFYGSIYYHPEDLAQTSVSFQIDVKTIDTNNDWRDQDLQSGNWFLAEKYPHIKFSSTAVKAKAEGLLVTGMLTVKDVTKEISFPIAPAIDIKEDMRGDHQVIFTGAHTINRKEYGVMGKNWSQVKEGIAALSDEVKIEFSLLGKQIKEENFKNYLRSERSPHGAIYTSYKTAGLEGAKKRFEELRKEKEINASALNMVVYMLIQQHKNEEALSLIQYNQKAFPDNADIYDFMADVYARLGKLKKAKENYQKALQLDPDNMNAAEALKHLK